MKVRPQPRSKTSPQSHPLYTLALLALPVLSIFLSSVLLKRDNELPRNYNSPRPGNTAMGNVATEYWKNPTQDRPAILYEKNHKKSSAGTVRYAAYVRGNNSGDQKLPLTIRRWAGLMVHEDKEYAAELALNLSQILENSSFPGFRFETKGCRRSNIDEKQFEFVLVKDPYLSDFAASADSSAFAEHFSDDGAPAVVFSNLGGTAVLIAPQPIAPNVKKVYGHCANFARNAPRSQLSSTWRMAVRSFLNRIEERDGQTVWFSTAGTGVAWLHFRLDDRPKYYRYEPFAMEK